RYATRTTVDPRRTCPGQLQPMVRRPGCAKTHGIFGHQILLMHESVCRMMGSWHAPQFPIGRLKLRCCREGSDPSRVLAPIRRYLLGEMVRHTETHIRDIQAIRRSQKSVYPLPPNEERSIRRAPRTEGKARRIRARRIDLCWTEPLLRRRPVGDSIRPGSRSDRGILPPPSRQVQPPASPFPYLVCLHLRHPPPPRTPRFAA